MREIPSSQGLVVLVDDEDYESLAGHRWYAHNNNRSTKRPARRLSGGKRKVVFLVHEIMGVPEKGMVIDHINGDPWDNRRANLRLCTHAQNLKNQHRKRKSNGAGKGVHWIGGAWVVLICNEGERYRIGTFKDRHAAELAYDAAALYLHGEYACLNHPDAGTLAQSPAALREIHAKPVGRPNKHTGDILPLLRQGMNATQAAKHLGIGITTACKIAKAHGLGIGRGRPRKAA